MIYRRPFRQTETRKESRVGDKDKTEKEKH